MGQLNQGTINTSCLCKWTERSFLNFCHSFDRTPASRPSDFVNYSTYNYRLNWTPLGPITITIYNRYHFLKCDWCISCFIFHLSFCTVVIGQLAVIGQASKQTLKLFFTRIRHLSIGKHVRKKSAYTLFKNKNEKKNDKLPN